MQVRVGGKGTVKDHFPGIGTGLFAPELEKLRERIVPICFANLCIGIADHKREDPFLAATALGDEIFFNQGILSMVGDGMEVQVKGGPIAPQRPVERPHGWVPGVDETVNLERIRASIPGKSWQDWPPHLVNDCHSNQDRISWRNVYGRMGWHLPAPTITTQFYTYGCGRFGHPEQDRALSLREGALLQSFPAGYEFVPPETTRSKRDIARLIGNAVPPALARRLGRRSSSRSAHDSTQVPKIPGHRLSGTIWNH